MVKRSKKSDETRESRIGLRLHEDLRLALEALAEADGRSLSAYVERVLAEHVRTADRKKSRS